MNNVSKDTEILRMKQKEMLEIKSIITEIKNTFDGLTSRLNMAKRSESLSLKISQ